ncbi:MAG: ATP-binding protein [Candidatus Kapaibacterium sp.]
MMQNFEFEIKSSCDDVRSVLGKMRDIVEKKGYREHAGDFELCAAEALNNICGHSYSDSVDGDIYIKLVLMENQIILKLKDWGNTLMDYSGGSSAPEVNPGDIENLPERGFGMHIISNLCDEAVYEKSNGYNLHILKMGI